MAGKLYEAPIGNKALDLLALRLTMRRIAATLSVIALLFSAGATLADDTDEANKLYIEAAKLIKLAENIEGFGEKAEVLEEAPLPPVEILEDSWRRGRLLPQSPTLITLVADTVPSR